MKILTTINEIEKFIESGGMKLLYISRPDCGVCKSLLPRVKMMLRDFPGIEGAYIDLDKLPEASGRFTVFTIPAILLFVEGKETIREARYVSLESLKGRITRYYSLLYS